MTDGGNENRFLDSNMVIQTHLVVGIYENGNPEEISELFDSISKLNERAYSRIMQPLLSGGTHIIRAYESYEEVMTNPDSRVVRLDNLHDSLKIYYGKLGKLPEGFITNVEFIRNILEENRREIKNDRFLNNSILQQRKVGEQTRKIDPELMSKRIAKRGGTPDIDELNYVVPFKSPTYIGRNGHIDESAFLTDEDGNPIES